ncbi:hypothetical protein ACWGK1_00480 [Streptomyces wedmorensis]
MLLNVACVALQRRCPGNASTTFVRPVFAVLLMVDEQEALRL